MATDNVYRIEDEPRPGALAKFAVSPFWPLLGLMMGGLWLGLPWFVLNSIAVGCPNRVKEWIWAGVGLVGSVVIALGLLWLINTGYLNSQVQLQYAILILVVWKLSIGYVLFTQQSATIELYQYYGGELNRFAPLVALGGAFLLRGAVLKLLPSDLWFLVMS